MFCVVTTGNCEFLLQAKKNYESSCKESEQIDVKVNTAKNAAVTTIGHKEFEKVKKLVVQKWNIRKKPPQSPVKFVLVWI